MSLSNLVDLAQQAEERARARAQSSGDDENPMKTSSDGANAPAGGSTGSSIRRPLTKQHSSNQLLVRPQRTSSLKLARAPAMKDVLQSSESGTSESGTSVTPRPSLPAVDLSPPAKTDKEPGTNDEPVEQDEKVAGDADSSSVQSVADRVSVSLPASPLQSPLSSPAASPGRGGDGLSSLPEPLLGDDERAALFRVMTDISFAWKLPVGPQTKACDVVNRLAMETGIMPAQITLYSCTPTDDGVSFVSSRFKRDDLLMPVFSSLPNFYFGVRLLDPSALYKKRDQAPPTAPVSDSRSRQGSVTQPSPLRNSLALGTSDIDDSDTDVAGMDDSGAGAGRSLSSGETAPPSAADRDAELLAELATHPDFGKREFTVSALLNAKEPERSGFLAAFRTLQRTDPIHSQTLADAVELLSTALADAPKKLPEDARQFRVDHPVPLDVARRLLAEAGPQQDDDHVRAYSLSALDLMREERPAELDFESFCLSSLGTPHGRSVRRVLATALANLSTDRSLGERVFAAIGDHMVAWAQSSQMELKEAVACILANLTSVKTLTDQLVNVAVEILVKLACADGSPPYKRHAARGLANLSVFPEACSGLLDAGCMELAADAVVPYAGDDKPSADYMRNMLRVMANIMAAPGSTGEVAVAIVGTSDDWQRQLELYSRQQGTEEIDEKMASHAFVCMQNLANRADVSLSAEATERFTKLRELKLPLEEAAQVWRVPVNRSRMDRPNRASVLSTIQNMQRDARDKKTREADTKAEIAMARAINTANKDKSKAKAQGKSKDGRSANIAGKGTGVNSAVAGLDSDLDVASLRDKTRRGVATPSEIAALKAFDAREQDRTPAGVALQKAQQLRAAGKHSEAVDWLLTKLTEQPLFATPGMYYELASLEARLGQLEDAMMHLEKAVEHGYSDFNRMGYDPELALLRRRPRFTALLDKLTSGQSGWLEHPEGALRKWRRRWFVLSGARLLAFASKGDTTPVGETLLLRGTQVVRSSGGNMRRVELFVPGAKGPVRLRAASSADLTDWLVAFGSAIRSAPHPTTQLSSAGGSPGSRRSKSPGTKNARPTLGTQGKQRSMSIMKKLRRFSLTSKSAADLGQYIQSGGLEKEANAADQENAPSSAASEPGPQRQPSSGSLSSLKEDEELCDDDLPVSNGVGDEKSLPKPGTENRTPGGLKTRSHSLPSGGGNFSLES